MTIMISGMGTGVTLSSGTTSDIFDDGTNIDLQ